MALDCSIFAMSVVLVDVDMYSSQPSHHNNQLTMVDVDRWSVVYAIETSLESECTTMCRYVQRYQMDSDISLLANRIQYHRCTVHRLRTND